MVIWPPTLTQIPCPQELLPLSQEAPPPRAFPGLVKPDQDTLVMFGGYSDGSGLSDLWKLNVVSSLWTPLEQEDKTSASKAYPAAFSAFTYFYVPNDKGGQDLILTTTMGLKDSYKAGVSFARGGPPDAQGLYQVTDAVRWTMWLPSGVSTGVWNRMKPNDVSTVCCSTGNPGKAVQKMCTDAGMWSPDACSFEARAMHTMTNGNFVAGSPSLLLFGGLQREGLALKDLWSVDLMNNMMVMPKFYLYLTGMPSKSEWPADESLVTADLKAIIVKLVELSTNIPEAWPDKQVTWADLDIYDMTFEGQDASMTKFTFKISASRGYIYVALHPQLAPNLFPSALIAASLQTTVFQNAALSCPEGEDGSICGIMRYYDDSGVILHDVGLVTRHYDDTMACNPADPNSRCARGICMGSIAATKGLVTKDEHDQKQFCFHQSISATNASTTPCTATTKTDVDGVETVSTSETSDYRCSLPGPRHGHRAEKLTLLGKILMFAIFGGEASNFDAGSSVLTNDIHMLSFTATQVTWVKLWTSCDDANHGAEPLCPEARRDSAVAVMGNQGGDNGRLLVYGGMGAGGIKAYLEESSASSIVSYDDLWYLDLSLLDEACAIDGLCSQSLRWTKVEVPGGKPMTGFGAGVLLDPSDNLFIIGGAQRAATQFEERGELFVFKLRDPFFKHCSATGSALTAGIAGVQSVFYLQCMDSFMQPADGASFAVKISGPVDIIPGIVGEGNGLYSCSFTPVRVGTYSLSIFMGRGGRLAPQKPT
jgi:hypothetical protein